MEAILEMLHSQEFTKIDDYLDNCYRDAFIGSLYDLQGQNVPLIFPIDQKQVVKALQLDSQISEGLYKRLGEDITTLKKTISEEISRGISTSMMYSDIARNISNVTNTGYSNAKRIVVTEGHRIQNESTLECARQAKKRGADKLHIPVSELRSYSGQIIPIKAKNYEDFKRQYNQIWHYEGSDLQKEAEARIASYKKGK